MTKKKRLWQRIAILIMAFVFTLGLMPADSYALLGPVVTIEAPNGSKIPRYPVYADVEPLAVSGDSGHQVAKISNDYITFEILADPYSRYEEGSSGLGTYCRTVPTKYYNDSDDLMSSVKNNIYQELQFSVKWDYNGKEERLIPYKAVPKKDPDDPNRSLLVSYEFLDSEGEFLDYEITADVKFQLAQVYEGGFTGSYSFPMTEESYKETVLNGYQEDRHGQTWLVVSSVKFTTERTTDPKRQGLIYMNLINHRMPYYGHENERKAKKLVGSFGRAYRWTHQFEAVNVSEGIDWSKGSNGIDVGLTEVGTASYDEANPLVVMGNSHSELDEFPYTNTIERGVEGGNGFGFISAGDYVKYVPPKADGKVSSTYDVLSVRSHDGSADVGYDEIGVTSQIWGFRNLYKAGEHVVPLIDDGVPVIDSEFEYASTSAAKLAIIPDKSSSTGFKVKELGAKDAVPGEAVTVYQGTFTYYPKLGYYDFYKGSALLSPTISANFNTNNGEYFHLRPDGSVDHKGIRLSIPSYCFYKPIDAGDENAEPQFSYDKDKGLVIGITPDNNDAVVKIDLPFAKTVLEKASVNVKGDIVFSGGLHLDTVFDAARFDLSQLAMGNNSDGKFTIKGLEAELDVNKVKLMGLGIDKAYGKINTFTDYYKFDVQVNAYDVFKFAAALELMRTNDGVLMPNKLYGELVVPAMGLPLVPPAPIAEINGGGIGFDNLVKTINGEYYAIPPVNVTLTASGKILKTISGKLSATAGASGIRLKGSGLKIPDEKGLKLVDSVEVYFLDEGATEYIKTWNGQNIKEYFTGVNLKGGLDIKASILNKTSSSGTPANDKEEEQSEGEANENGTDSNGHDWSDVLIVDGGADLSVFGGTNANSSKLYLKANTTGRMDAKLSAPKWWPVIGGKSVAHASALVSLFAETLVNLKGTSADQFNNALKNLNGYVGICCKASIAGVYGRAYYVTPRTIGGGIKFGDPGDINFTDYYNRAKAGAKGQAAGLYDEDGEQVGVMVLDEGIKEQPAKVTAKSGTRASDQDGIQVSLGEGASISPNDTVVLQVKPEGGASVDKDEFLAGLDVDGNAVKEIKLDSDTGENTNGGNVMLTLDDNDKVVSAGVFLDNTKTEWTVHSAAAVIDPQPKFYVSSPDIYEALEDASFTATERTLSAKAINLDENVRYELHTYMGSEKDSGEYSIGDPIVINPGTDENGSPVSGVTEYSYSVDIPEEGTIAETGDYYISTALVKVMKGDFDGDGTVAEDEVSQIALDRWESPDKVHYTNTNTPDAPTGVSIEAAGNETLKCSFNKVASTDTCRIDGYRIRILKDGEDTGYGYDFAVKREEDPDTHAVTETLEDAGSSSAVTQEGNKYSFLFAPTVSGDTLTDDEETLSEDLQQDALKPGSGYTLGVSAYRTIAADSSLLDAEDALVHKVYSAETISGSAKITSYKEADLKIELNGKEITKNAETGIYEGIISPDARDLKVSVTSDGDYEINVEKETDDTAAPEVLSADGSQLEKTLGEFKGSAMYDIVATNKDTKDRTNAFLQISVDDVAPALLMDADTFNADRDGNYVVSGTTDAGAVVNGVTAGEDGRFEITGSIRQRYYSVMEKTMTYILTVKDEVLDLDQEYPPFTDEEEFNYYVDDMRAQFEDFQISPATWSGTDETYKVSYSELVSETYSEDQYNDLKAREESGSGEVSGLDVYYRDSWEVPEDRIDYFEQNFNPEIEKYEIRDRYNSKDMTVTAEDENGNKTQAAVKVNSHSHSLKEVAAVPGNCKNEGTRAHFECTDCGDKFEDAAGTIPAEDLTTPIDPDHHVYGAWKHTKAATVFAKGQDTRTCKYCGHKETRTVAKLKAKISLNVGKIKVSKTTVPLKKGQSFKKIKATMAKGDKVAKVTSSKPKIVKVKKKGKTIILTAAKKTGKSVITVKTAAGVKATFKVKVQKKKVTARKIVGFKKYVTIKKGKKYKIPSDVSPVTVTDKMKFKSSKKSVATVSSKGVIKAKKKGKAKITITIGKKIIKCYVKVK